MTSINGFVYRSSLFVVHQIIMDLIVMNAPTVTETVNARETELAEVTDNALVSTVIKGLIVGNAQTDTMNRSEMKRYYCAAIAMLLVMQSTVAPVPDPNTAKCATTVGSCMTISKLVAILTNVLHSKNHVLLINSV